MARSNIRPSGRRRRNVKKAIRKRGNRKGRSSGMFNDAGQTARIKETVEFTDINPGLGYDFVFNLSQFRRASALAPNFKWYKATSVEWTIEPLYNTFQDGTTGAEVSVPYMYMTMNRTQDSLLLGLADLQGMGAKPKKLVAKTVIKYKPNWCSPGLQQLARFVDPQSPTGYTLAEVDSAGLKAQYSYLQCPNKDSQIDNNPQFSVPIIAPSTTYPPGLSVVQAAILTNQVVYNGHTLYVDQKVPTGLLQPVARITCTVHWHFKGPHFIAPAQPGKVNEVVAPISA